MLDLQNLIGAVLDNVGNGVTVGRAKQKGLHYEQIQSALQEIGLKWRCASFWHELVPQDHRPECPGRWFQKMI